MLYYWIAVCTQKQFLGHGLAKVFTILAIFSILPPKLLAGIYAGKFKNDFTFKCFTYPYTPISMWVCSFLNPENSSNSGVLIQCLEGQSQIG